MQCSHRLFFLCYVGSCAYLSDLPLSFSLSWIDWCCFFDPAVVKRLALLGPVKERFDSCEDTFEPIQGGLEDRCFISKSYDDSSHFKSAAEDVLDMYQRITGAPLDLNIPTKIPQPGDY